jgi:hypothetical protein
MESQVRAGHLGFKSSGIPTSRAASRNCLATVVSCPHLALVDGNAHSGDSRAPGGLGVCLGVVVDWPYRRVISTSVARSLMGSSTATQLEKRLNWVNRAKS